MCNALKYYDGINRCPILTQFATDGLNENMSIVAIDNVTNKLLGVVINQTAKPSHVDPEEELQEYLKAYNDPKFSHILRVLHRVNQNAGDIFTSLDTSIFFDMKMATTDVDCRGGGLLKDLLQRSLDLARVLRFKAVKAEATGKRK